MEENIRSGFGEDRQVASPMSDQPAPGISKMGPLLAKAEPYNDAGGTSGITYLRKTKIAMQQLGERGVRKCKRNNTAGTKVSDEGGAPGARASLATHGVDLGDAGCLPAAHGRQQSS